MTTTKRFYEQAQRASHLLTIGHYDPTIDDAYKSGGSVEKRRAFFRLYYKFVDMQKEGKIVIYRMGIISAGTQIFTFACNFFDTKDRKLKCYYTTPYNDIIINPCQSWEDFKREQKRKGL